MIKSFDPLNMVWEFCKTYMAGLAEGAGSRGSPGWAPELWAAPEVPGPVPPLLNKEKTGGPLFVKGNEKERSHKKKHTHTKLTTTLCVFCLFLWSDLCVCLFVF